ncbi:GNAT family N-acetyltransferase [Streptomyces sp. NPDC101209]|uniref:GNAT family N-acetyltransferase n=1 Tax=Streptomyces sp. NPDC101209 TaxID=3366129 RepID=UPI0037FF3A76
MAEVLLDDIAKHVKVVDEPKDSRYALYVCGLQVATLSYCVVERQRVLGHTEFKDVRRGQGLSRILIQTALDDLRERRAKTVIHLAATPQVVQRSVKFADAIDPSHPGFWISSVGRVTDRPS